MATYYCEYHGELHDGDWIPCVEHPNGRDLICEDAAAEMAEEIEEDSYRPVPRNREFSPEQFKMIADMEREAFIAEIEGQRR